MSASLIENPFCRFCGNPVGQNIGGVPGYRYGDDTVICSNCHETSVKSDNALTTVWRFVVGSCTELGLDAKWSEVRVRLRNTPDLASMSGRHNTIGLARSQWCGPVIQSDITALYGMPWSHAANTLAHEAGHIWCHEHWVRFTPEEAEEGFANVVACLVLQRVPARFKPQACIEALFSNPDPLYGGWFRTEWQTMTKFSWDKYIKRIWRSHS